MEVAIVKYNAGNIQSVLHALDRLGISGKLTEDTADLLMADKVIFPGVGEASSAMNYLQERGLDRVIASLKQPVLGICLGLQLLCKHSEENDTTCMGIFDLEVKKFPPEDKVPHMGWNNIFNLEGPLFSGVNENEFVYFVHSYYAEKGVDTIATCDYIVPFSAAIRKSNFFATQFHPEKSGDIGSKILQNFISLT
ncbi:MAG: imidazole glycerol phosphate synthase subunit HisH [Flavobacteriales bacterium]|nr:imidazole glycerol phosphate synthase subunit HisH [Flavobacteriales bacterium]MCB9449771.1 imidazole glycerol phosphate synthase subunit HisH [Flavobacteriales bacterium]